MNTTPDKCPVCHSTHIALWSIARDYEYFSVLEEFSYFGCHDCDSIFIHPVPAGKLSVIYPANYYSFVNKGRNIVVKLKEWLDRLFFKKILRRLPGDKLNVLDVGGGTGWMLSLLRTADHRIQFTQSVDIDAAARTEAEANGHAYFEGTIEQFQTSRKFDLILMLNLVEHVKNPLAVLQKAESLLTGNGVIVIKTPNTRSWDARLYKKSYWGGLHCPRHWVIFSEKSFRLMLRSTTLQIKKLAYTQGAPFWAFSIIAALYRKRLVKISAQKPIIFHWLFAPLSACFALFDFLRRPFARTSQMFIQLGKKQVN